MPKIPLKDVKEPDQDVGAGDFVDPNPPQSKRLARKNVIALALTVVGVLLVLFFSSRRGPSRQNEVSVRSEPGYVGRAPIEIGASDDDQEVPPPQPSPWATSPYAETTPAGESEADPRQQRYEQALRSRPVLNVVSVASRNALENEPRADVLDLEAAAGEQHLPGGRSFHRASSSGQGTTPIRLVELSDYTVAEATVVEAALVTGINSDRPGPVVARVIRPVYDSKNMHHLLIPAGTQLVGALEQALEGQDRRVVLAWTRMIFPDGRSLDLPGFPAIETNGEGGLKDRVNLHMASLFGRAALIALLGGATTYASSQANGRSAVGPGTFLGAALGLELSRVATTMLQQGLRRRPTVTIRPGYRFLVYVAHDLPFEQPYVEMPSPPRFAVPTF
ncbi:MAG: TrbI/VirB10 family protein [Rhodothermales bacterium]